MMTGSETEERSKTRKGGEPGGVVGGVGEDGGEGGDGNWINWGKGNVVRAFRANAAGVNNRGRRSEIVGA